MEKLFFDKEEVINQYIRLKNIHKVAEYFKVSVSPIRAIIKSSNIELNNRRYSVNDKFFDNIDSEEKSYWLGFLFADGYIRDRESGKSLEMKLSIKDKDHLELFKKTLNSNHKIINTTSIVKYKDKISSSEMCHLAIYSTSIVESIKLQGMHSRKTFTIKEPQIDKNLMSHFIRGYFDGDGSFSFNPDKYMIKTQLVSDSKDFQDFIIKELGDNGIKINLYSKIKLQIQNKLDNLKFYNYIYNDSKIYLTRKKEKYEEFRRYYGYNN